MDNVHYVIVKFNWLKTCPQIINIESLLRSIVSICEVIVNAYVGWCSLKNNVQSELASEDIEFKGHQLIYALTDLHPKWKSVSKYTYRYK